MPVEGIRSFDRHFLSAPRLGFGYSQNRHFLVAYLQHELIYRALVINDEVDLRCSVVEIEVGVGGCNHSEGSGLSWAHPIQPIVAH